MRKILSYALIFFAFLMTSAAQDVAQLISEADRLITEHKYKTAYDTLGPSLDDVDIVLKKYEIVMNYYVNNIHYSLFSLKDIDKNESILDYRGKVGNFEMVMFEVDKVLPALIKKFPEDGRLYKAYGEYSHLVFTNYGELEGKPRDLLIKEMEANSLAAKKLGSADAKTNFIIGLAKLYNKDYSQGEVFLEECIRIDPNYADGHYNLAYALMYKDKQQEALTHVLKAYELYSDQGLKADAAIMAGQLYWELKDTSNSVKYYSAAESLKSDYRILGTVLQGLVRNGAIDEADTTAEKLLALQPTNPTLPQQIIQIYLGSKRIKELVSFFERMEKRFGDNDESAGNVIFHKAFVHIQTGEKEKAREALASAKARFIKCFPEDHQVFKAIEDLNKKLKDGERLNSYLRVLFDVNEL